MDKKLLTVKETANMIGIPLQTAYTWIHNCKIPSEKFGNQYMINLADLVELGFVKGYTDENDELFVL